MRLSGRVLCIGGSDSSGGAGVQADIKTLTALGAYAATAVTAITVQDTTRVHAVHALAPAIVAAQIGCVLADPGADAVKTGMLVDAATIDAVIAALNGPPLPLVVDPVMVATSGDSLLRDDAVAALWRLMRQATLVTPNVPEAARLTGCAIDDLDGMRNAATTMRAQGVAAVLVKGGHLAGEMVTDLLLGPAGETLFSHPRLPARHTHGTGCTLGAAIAGGLAQGIDLVAAARRAVAFVQAAIRAAPGWGQGHGPLNHVAQLADPAR